MLVETLPLHMLRCRFDLPALLRRVGYDGGASERFDLGYLVHWQLVSLFGSGAPATFSIQRQDGRSIDVLAYTERDADTLREQSCAADAAAVAACDWQWFGSRRMPTSWRAGLVLDFDVRACPIVRRSKDGPKGRRGAEVDAFLAACDAASGAPVDRMVVYRAWLAREFGRDGAASLEGFSQSAFRRVRLHRRTQGGSRVARGLERPDLSATGALRVACPEAFDRLLRRGIGRHRAFGFGMLLLRPAR